MNAAFLAFVAALAVALGLTPVLRRLARHLGWLDRPNERSSHKHPTPRTGGIAILLGIAAGTIAGGAGRDRSLLWIGACAILLAILGMLDDARNLTWKPKLLAQLVAAAAILSMPGLRFGVALGALALIWLVGVTNAFNFMDGVNGIAALEAMVCGIVMGVLFWRAGDYPAAVLAFAIAGGASGFFPWNAFTGSIFMGDVGSLPLGFLLATFVLRGGRDGIAPWVMALPLLPFLLDTGLTLVRRIARRERIVDAHRSHFYQRLTDLGWSHVAVTALWGGLAAIGGAVALTWSRFAAAGAVAIAAVLALHLAVFGFIEYRHSGRPENRARTRS